MSEMLMKPGVSLGSYPQRSEPKFNELEALIRGWGKRLRQGLSDARDRLTAAFPETGQSDDFTEPSTASKKAG